MRTCARRWIITRRVRERRFSDQILCSCSWNTVCTFKFTDLDGYCNADWGISYSRRSITHNIFRYNAAPILWKSQLQNSVTVYSWGWKLFGSARRLWEAEVIYMCQAPFGLTMHLCSSHEGAGTPTQGEEGLVYSTICVRRTISLWPLIFFLPTKKFFLPTTDFRQSFSHWRMQNLRKSSYYPALSCNFD